MSDRILFVSYTAKWGGPNNSLLLMLKHLRQRYNVAVLLPGRGEFSDKLSTEKIPFYSYPSLTKWTIPSVFRLIQREHFNLVYGNGRNGVSRNALIASKLANVPADGSLLTMDIEANRPQLLIE